MRRVLVAALVIAASTTSVMAAQTEIRARSATITIGGRLQAQTLTSSVGSANTIETKIRRARIFFGVAVGDLLRASILPSFEDGVLQLQDAFVSLHFDPAFVLSMGQMKRPSEVFEMVSSTRLSIIERDGRVPGAGDCSGIGGVCSFSRLTENLSFSGRDTGLRISGTVGRFSYGATVMNGTGINTRDENDGESFSVRTDIEVGSGLLVGGFLGSHDYLNPEGATDRATAYGVDLDWGEWTDGVHVQAAWVVGDNWKVLDSGQNPAKFMTGQAVITYFIPVGWERWAGIEPLARISWADPDRSVTDDGGWIFTPGLSLFISGRNKIGTNLDIYVPETGGTEFSFKLQAFAYF